MRDADRRSCRGKCWQQCGGRGLSEAKKDPKQNVF